MSDDAFFSLLIELKLSVMEVGVPVKLLHPKPQDPVEVAKPVPDLFCLAQTRPTTVVLPPLHSAPLLLAWPAVFYQPLLFRFFFFLLLPSCFIFPPPVCAWLQFPVSIFSFLPIVFSSFPLLLFFSLLIPFILGFSSASPILLQSFAVLLVALLPLTACSI